MQLLISIVRALNRLEVDIVARPDNHGRTFMYSMTASKSRKYKGIPRPTACIYGDLLAITSGGVIAWVQVVGGACAGFEDGLINKL